MRVKPPLLIAGFILAFCSIKPATGDQLHDEAAIRGQIAEYFAAIADRDIGSMEHLWVNAPNVTMLTPRHKRMAMGWPAVRKSFVGGVFSFWNAFAATPRDDLIVLVDDRFSTAMFNVDAIGENRAQQTVRYTIRNVQTFERRGGQWLLISSFATGAPE